MGFMSISCRAATLILRRATIVMDRKGGRDDV